MTPHELRHYRTEVLNETQAQMGLRLGYALSTVSSWEQGRAPIPRLVVERITSDPNYAEPDAEENVIFAVAVRTFILWASDLKFDEIAQLIGVSRSTLTRWKTGLAVPPTKQRMQALALMIHVMDEADAEARAAAGIPVDRSKA